jgi:hypothetical protein
MLKDFIIMMITLCIECNIVNFSFKKGYFYIYHELNRSAIGVCSFLLGDKIESDVIINHEEINCNNFDEIEATIKKLIKHKRKSRRDMFKIDFIREMTMLCIECNIVNFSFKKGHFYIYHELNGSAIRVCSSLLKGAIVADVIINGKKIHCNNFDEIKSTIKKKIIDKVD